MALKVTLHILKMREKTKLPDVSYKCKNYLKVTQITGNLLLNATDKLNQEKSNQNKITPGERGAQLKNTIK